MRSALESGAWVLGFQIWLLKDSFQKDCKWSREDIRRLNAGPLKEAIPVIAHLGDESEKTCAKIKLLHDFYW